jgi:3,4-dehydroadipyl-CoA semialdehyde dehydrogenase
MHVVEHLYSGRGTYVHELNSYLAGQWTAGSGKAAELVNPATGEAVAVIAKTEPDLGKALEFARRDGGKALGGMTYAERGTLVGKVADVLSANRAKYFEISKVNSGATEADASFDVDGAIYTLKYYAKAASGLQGSKIKDGARIQLAKTGAFAAQHFLSPLEGVAVLINAFNFPAWGLWEKVAPALIAGVPCFAKPASATSWLTQEMVKDVIDAGMVPPGVLSVLCGEAGDLLDHVREQDVICFTGSAATAAAIKTHPNVVARSVRLNVEADSLNAAILGPDVAPHSELFGLFVREIVREMTLKAGQKCTAIRRIFAPSAVAEQLSEAIAKSLESSKVGAPTDSEVKVGPVVNARQKQSAEKGIAELKQECSIVYQPKVDGSGAFVAPTLLMCNNGLSAKLVHDVEVFGPVATLIPYGSSEQLIGLCRKGAGSLVASVFSDDASFTARVVSGIAGLHGRIMVVDSSVGKQHTGHGNVLPQCLHGGPGRAGAGEELAGLRALLLYHRRYVVQGPPALLDMLSEATIEITQLFI